MAGGLPEPNTAAARYPERAVIDISGALLTDLLDGIDRSEPDADLRMRIRVHILNKLANPDFGPRTVAMTFGLSLERVHRLFVDTDNTVARFIRDERLSRIAQLLHTSNRPDIADLAAVTGFAGPDQMTRAFRQRFREPPTDYWHRIHQARHPEKDHPVLPRQAPLATDRRVGQSPAKSDRRS